ncbi:MAG TPA: FAD-binding protein [Candidatus Eisenbacteria bacterium]|nr:FAD-binding protein [Candidatus Eisenbacteria bacterium]
MKGLPAETDFIVVGVGVAGLRAAIELAAAGRVLILNKKEIPSFKSQDWKSEALWLSDEEEVTLHLQDSLTAGDGLCNPAAVKILLEEGAERIDELIGWDAHGSKHLVFELENARSKVRVLHSKGASTGREVLRVLYEKVEGLKNISIAPFTFVTDLRTDSGRITGVAVLDEKGVPHEIACSAVLLATGGIGQIYRNTTNPEAATADGIALAFRAGAEVGDMEFVQFYPTALYMKKVPRFLVDERLRSEGGYLRNFELDRFMAKYHPLGERAPSALVSRAIVHEMEVSRAKDPFVYLDVTHMNAAKAQKLFSRVYETCMAYNIDISEDLIPVRPAAHFGVGGVRTDLDGKTNVTGLYAAGEVAVTGAHGANRMASNSLLESLVFGARAGKVMISVEKSSGVVPEPKEAAYSNGPVDAAVEQTIGQIQDLMWNEVGVARIRTGMQKAVKALEEMAPKLTHPKTKRAHEAANLQLAALLVARSALAREESRGAHYRIDYPDHDDRKFLKHSVARNDKIVFI